MKHLEQKLVLIILLVVVACNTAKKEVNKIENIKVIENDSIIKENISFDTIIDNVKNELKIAEIKAVIDDYQEVEDSLKNKRFYKETENYCIDFCYPYLNENFNPKFENFNNYIENQLLKLPEIESNIIESQALLCEVTGEKPTVEYRLAEYKVFLQSEDHLSILFYLENHYSDTKATYYTFKTINFDMISGKILNFDDYFSQGTTEDVLSVINDEITTEINKGDMHYECFNVTLTDFEQAKNNFVINDNSIEFYFNDCVMCPSFVGTYEIEVSLEKLKFALKHNWEKEFSL